MPPEATITACARSAEVADDLSRTALAALDVVGSRIVPLTPSTVPLVMRERIDAVAELEGQPAARLRLARPPLERLDDAGAGAPGDMKPRHRIAVAHRIVAAALGPADHRKDPMAHRAQPVALFAGGERHIGFGPAPRPEVLVAVEAGRSHPVLQREVVTVLDAEPALFGAVDQEQSAERPERLAAEALFAFLVDHDDAFAGVGDFGRRDEAREAPADHDYVRILVPSRHSPGSCAIEARAFTAVNGKWRRARPRCATPVNLFQFGTFPGAGCSPPATLNLNLIGAIPAIWTKSRSGNTLASLHHQGDQIRVRQVWTGAGT